MLLAPKRYRSSRRGRACGSSLLAAAVGSMLLVALGMPLAAASCEREVAPGHGAAHSHGDSALHTAHAPRGDATRSSGHSGPEDQPDAPVDCAAAMWCSVAALLVDAGIHRLVMEGMAPPSVPAAVLASVRGGPEPPPPRA